MRPSYVLSGAAMNVAENKLELKSIKVSTPMTRHSAGHRSINILNFEGVDRPIVLPEDLSQVWPELASQSFEESSDYEKNNGVSHQLPLTAVTAVNSHDSQSQLLVKILTKNLIIFHLMASWEIVDPVLENFS